MSSEGQNARKQMRFTLQQLMSVWSALDARRRAVVILATAAVFIAVLMLSRMAATPGMTLLYAGLESGPAGEVVSALEQRGVVYDVRGGSIFVESGKRDELRMTLASEGLPTNSTAGYELLDSLSGFGTTSQMFDAAYWRAKEGELARTIVASPQVNSARVHISSPSSQPFKRGLKATASVTVSTGAGALSAPHAKAFKFLVASAVAGLAPEDVAIIDSKGGLILAADEVAAAAGGADGKADDLKQRVERLLEAHVGYGNAVVEVSVETIMDRESIVERRFDPESRVAISTETEERTVSAEDSGSGSSVSVASNLPTGDGATDGATSSSKNSETRERVNFEVSETQRELVKVPGAVKRVTVAVLVDGMMRIDETGAEVFVPRSEDELGALRELVESAVGFDETRGDVITLKSLAFEPIAAQGTAAGPSMVDRLGIDVMSLIQLVVLAIVTLALGLFVIRPIISNAPIASLPAPAPEADSDEALPDIGTLPALTGEISDSQFEAPNLALGSDFGSVGEGIDAPGDLPALTRANEDPVARLRQLIDERQEETVEILRSWMEDSEEKV